MGNTAYRGAEGASRGRERICALRLLGYPTRGEKRDSWHSESWLTVEELTTFDYDRTFEDRDPIIDIGGTPCYEEGLEDAMHRRRMKTYREFLGPEFLSLLDTLKAAGIERVVFWFDN
jgi:hypothetical protein